MKAIATIAAAAVLAAGAAGAEPPSKQAVFCAELKRVVKVAERDGDFAYLERSRARPPSLGFPHRCKATGDRNKQYWQCGQGMAPESMSRENLAARVASCLPQAARTDQEGRQTLFKLGRTEIRVSDGGGPGEILGLMVQLIVERVPAP